MYISEIPDLIQIHSYANTALTRLKKHVRGKQICGKNTVREYRTDGESILKMVVDGLLKNW